MTEADLQLQLYRQLLATCTRIHAAHDLDALMQDLPAELCQLFDCDRSTLFVVDRDRDYMLSREQRVAVTPHNLPGYVALTHQTLNIGDVYDVAELRAISPELHFQPGLDQRTGYRTRQLLAAPVLNSRSKELLGVLQLVNTRSGRAFPAAAVEGLQALGETLAVALAARQLPQHAAGAPAAPEAGEEAPATLAERVITEACRLDATGIHIEPHPQRGISCLRLRRDGVLQPYAEIALAAHAPLVARLKTMCGLSSTPSARPLEGKLLFRDYSQLDVELRATFIPSHGGMEDVVLRLLATGAPQPLERLGMRPAVQDQLRNAIDRPHGLFLVCAPAGNGRTTALHALLHQLDRPDAKTWTIEDPVEITQPGARQVALDRAAGMGFPAALGAVLRADPDVVAVGELRDEESAGMAIEAALSGRLVLGGLGGDDAAAALARLQEMGCERFALADALLGVLALRLVRRLCEHCKLVYQPGDAELALLLAEYCEDLQHSASYQRDARAAQQRIVADWRERHGDARGNFRLYRPVGCAACNKGYQGRLGLQELLVPDERARQLLRERAAPATLRTAALENGMLTLKMDGIEKVLAGLTDVKAVRGAR